MARRWPSPPQRSQPHGPPPLRHLLAAAVSRIKARSDLYEMDLVLDVNVDVYPIEVGDKLGLCLASTLQLDGGPTSASFDVVSVGGAAARGGWVGGWRVGGGSAGRLGSSPSRPGALS